MRRRCTAIYALFVLCAVLWSDCGPATAATATTEAAAAATLEKWKRREKKLMIMIWLTMRMVIHVMPWYRSFSFYSETETKTYERRRRASDKWKKNNTKIFIFDASDYFTLCCRVYAFYYFIDRSIEDGKWSSIYCFIISVHGMVRSWFHGTHASCVCVIGGDASSSSSSWRRQTQQLQHDDVSKIYMFTFQCAKRMQVDQ